MAKSKQFKIDGWDILFFAIIGYMTYLTYIAPTVEMSSLSLMKQFVFTITDKVYGWLIFALVFKKILDKADI